MALRNSLLSQRTAAPIRILIVEDEETSRRALASLLRSVGYDVVGAASAEEALRDVAKDEPPQFALVDLDLPGMDGIEFIRRLRKSTDFFPVLITASGADDVGPRAHANDVLFMRKPIDYPRLVSILSENAPIH